MRKRTRGAIVLAALLLSTASSFAGDSDPAEFTQISHGRYLAILSDCSSCHTVPGSDQPFAGGRAIETPFGNIVAPNITPDPETGIGSWSDEAFDEAVRHGIGRNGSRLYPAMPYNAYTKMSRDDVLAVRAYLNTVTPVRNAVVADTLPFPFNIRTAMRVWDALYFKDGDYQPDPNKSAEWNRGAFLVDGPGHCGACHTPKTFLGGDKTDQYLEGAYLQGWSAPDITNDARLGLGRWSKDDVASYLKSGHNHITAATGPMGEVVVTPVDRLHDGSRSQCYRDLSEITAQSDRSGPPHFPRAIRRWWPAPLSTEDQCSACHGLDGKGVAELFPSIADSSMVKSNDPTTSIRIVLRGARSVGTSAQPTASGMPSYGRQLNDDQVAAALTYMRNSWGGAASPG